MLASGERRLTAGVIGADLKNCVERTGCLALAYLPDAGDSVWQRLKRQGVRRVEHFADRYYILALERGAKVRAALLHRDIRAIDMLRAMDKLPPAATAEHLKQTNRVALISDDRGRTQKRTFAQLGLSLTRAGVRAAARHRWVYRVAAARMSAKPTTIESREAVGVDDVQGFSLKGGAPSYSGYSGEGIVVMVMDRGVDKNNQDLFSLDASGKPSSTRVVGAPPNMGNMSTHGTGVSSVLAGSGYNGNGYGQKHYGQPAGPYPWRGMAPRVSKIVSVYPSMTDAAKAEAEHGTHLSNHSHELDYLGYREAVRVVDELVFTGAKHNGVTFSPRPVIWSAGNAGLVSQRPVHGYYALTTHAKNTITVGGTNANDDSFWRFASHGPWLLEPLPLDTKTYKTGYDPIKPSDVKAATQCVEAAAWKNPKCEDHRNNMEQVLVEKPEAGWWTIQIRGHKVPKGPQRYSLIVAGSCS